MQQQQNLPSQHDAAVTNPSALALASLRKKNRCTIQCNGNVCGRIPCTTASYRKVNGNRICNAVQMQRERERGIWLWKQPASRTTSASDLKVMLVVKSENNVGCEKWLIERVLGVINAKAKHYLVTTTVWNGSEQTKSVKKCENTNQIKTKSKWK